jgi:dTDP-4-amino-4,6-dideoxygalactose transaminase
VAVNLFVPTFQIEECLAEIRDCLEKGWTGLGFKTVEFEKQWCDFTGLPHAHFVSSCSAALHLAVDVFRTAYGWEDGDEIITTPLTFVSSNHVILYERLKPVFADVDDMLCLDPADVERKITPRSRAVMFVGMGGNTGQLSAIQLLCKKHGLKLILDAAHMAGTRLNGATPTADAACYSFHAVKNLPTGDSGMICFAEASHDEMCRKKAWMGISKDTFARTSNKGAYRWLYDVEYLGWKYNGNSIMAAIGLVQLKYVDRDNAFRRQICRWYEAGFADAPKVGVVPTAPGCESSHHLFQIHVDNRDELMLALNESGIYPGVHYRDNRAYSIFHQETDDCPNATRISNRIISLPLHMRLTKADVDEVVSAVCRYAG